MFGCSFSTGIIGVGTGERGGMEPGIVGSLGGVSLSGVVTTVRGGRLLFEQLFPCVRADDSVLEFMIPKTLAVCGAPAPLPFTTTHALPKLIRTIGPGQLGADT